MTQVTIKQNSESLSSLVRQMSNLKRDFQKLEEKFVEQIKLQEATELLRKKILNLKKRGITTGTVIDLHFETGLPIEIINQIMEEFEKEGHVAEHVSKE